MFCPECEGEFREGFTRCARCNVALVDSLPQDPELTLEQAPEPDPNLELISAFRARSMVDLAVAESLLVEQDISYFKKGDGLQDLLAGGRLGLGYNLALGPAELQVDRSDYERVRELLADLEEDDGDAQPFQGED